MFPNLSTIAKISLTIPVTTASVEKCFSEMKLIKPRLRSSLSDKHLMKIAIEAPDQLNDDQLEEIVDIWNRKKQKENSLTKVVYFK